MSIINDALKKAGQPVTANPTNQKAAPKNIQPVMQKYSQRARFNWGPLFVAVIFLLIAGPIIVPYLEPHVAQWLHTGQETDLASNQVSVGPEISPTMKAQFAVEEMPAPTAPAATPQTILGLRTPAKTGNGFRLSGIVYSKGESYCLINGRVLKIGETVSGAVLESISPNEVTLNRQGQIIRLTAETH